MLFNPSHHIPGLSIEVFRGNILHFILSSRIGGLEGYAKRIQRLVFEPDIDSALIFVIMLGALHIVVKATRQFLSAVAVEVIEQRCKGGIDQRGTSSQVGIGNLFPYVGGSGSGAHEIFEVEGGVKVTSDVGVPSAKIP